MIDYEKIIEEAVKKEVEVLGAGTAVNAARKVEGLDISEEGEVNALERNGKKVLEDLVKKYQKIGGSVSASLIAREIQTEIDDDSDLPEILAKRIREEKLASAI